MGCNLEVRRLGEHTKWISQDTPSRWKATKLVPKYIVIHQTACMDCDADRMYRSYNNKPVPRSAGCHAFIDGGVAYEIVDPQYITWNCGGGNTITNFNSIGLECCIFTDKAKYIESVKHTARVTAYYMLKFNIPISNVVTHRDASGKYCPEQLLNAYHGITWGDFKAFITAEIKELTEPKVEPVVATTTKIRINGIYKECDSINVGGFNYIKLRDLAGGVIRVDFKDGVPTLDT